MFSKNRWPHAVLFQGPKGSGKTQRAWESAKTLLCQAEAAVSFCGDCQACRLVDQRSHPDLLILEPEKDSASIKIEQVRERLIPRVNMRPMMGTRKVFLIEAAHRLGEEAQNALLKTLEEPEGHSYFILTSSAPERLLSTVRSRVVALKFTADGFPKAISPAAQERRSEVLDFVRDGARRGDAFPDLSKLEREEVCALLEVLIEYFRGRLLEGIGHAAVEDEWIERIEETALAKERIRQNTNIRLTLADLWISFISQPHSIT